MALGQQQYKKGTDGRLYYRRSDGKWVPVGGGTTPGYTPPAGGAPSPAAAASASAGGPAPFDFDQANRVSAGEQNRSKLLGDLNVDVLSESSKAGFKYDPVTGTFGGIDPSNPFSRAALLQKNYEQSRQQSQLSHDRGVLGNTTSFAARGQLYSGALNNAQGEQERLFGERGKQIQQSYDTGYNQLRTSYDDYIRNWLRRKRDVQGAGAETLAAGAFPG